MSIFSKIFKKSEKKKKSVETQDVASPQEKPQEKKAPAKETVKKTRPISKKYPSYVVLIRPVITEKATDLSAQNKFVFEVSRRANKITVRQAVESKYGVRVDKVNIANVRGKKVRYGRVEGRTKKWRKAIVTLKEGDKIEM